MGVARVRCILGATRTDSVDRDEEVRRHHPEGRPTDGRAAGCRVGAQSI